jgi:uncharacterized protein YjiS (DUF1127 family)
MALLNDFAARSAAPTAMRSAIAHTTGELAKLINNWIAGLIAQREYQANVALLRSFSDRQLKDVGLDRRQVEKLAEAGDARSRIQQAKHAEESMDWMSRSDSAKVRQGQEDRRKPGARISPAE